MIHYEGFHVTIILEKKTSKQGNLILQFLFAFLFSEVFMNSKKRTTIKRKNFGFTYFLKLVVF